MRACSQESSEAIWATNRSRSSPPSKEGARQEDPDKRQLQSPARDDREEARGQPLNGVKEGPRQKPTEGEGQSAGHVGSSPGSKNTSVSRSGLR